MNIGDPPFHNQLSIDSKKKCSENIKISHCSDFTKLP